MTEDQRSRPTVERPESGTYSSEEGQPVSDPALAADVHMPRPGLQRAKQVLRLLIHGTDPATGEELSADTIVNRVDVNQALLIAVTAIDKVATRAARRAHLPSAVHRKWSPEEEETLTALFKNGQALEEIARRHHRTVRAIETRLEKVGLITADQRTTRNTFAMLPPKGGAERRHAEKP